MKEHLIHLITEIKIHKTPEPMMKTYGTMSLNCNISLWTVCKVILLINTLISSVLSFQKLDTRSCSLFVPLDEKLSSYSQYNSALDRGKSYLLFITTVTKLSYDYLLHLNSIINCLFFFMLKRGYILSTII